MVDVPGNRNHDVPTHGAEGICGVSTISFHFRVVLQTTSNLCLVSGSKDSSSLDRSLSCYSMGSPSDRIGYFKLSRMQQLEPVELLISLKLFYCFRIDIS